MLTAFLLLAGTMAQSPVAIGYLNANGLMEKCESGSAPMLSYCFAYIAGVNDTAKAYESWLNMREYCLPPATPQGICAAYLSNISSPTPAMAPAKQPRSSSSPLRKNIPATNDCRQDQGGNASARHDICAPTPRSFRRTGAPEPRGRRGKAGLRDHIGTLAPGHDGILFEQAGSN